jgi:hypothetical protein
MAMWSSLLHPTTDLATLFTATWTCDSDSGVAAVDPGSLGLTTTGRQRAIFPMSRPLPRCRSSWPRVRCCASRATRPARKLNSLAREWRYGFTEKFLSNVTPGRSKLGTMYNTYSQTCKVLRTKNVQTRIHDQARVQAKYGQLQRYKSDE